MINWKLQSIKERKNKIVNAINVSYGPFSPFQKLSVKQFLNFTELINKRCSFLKCSKLKMNETEYNIQIYETCWQSSCKRKKKSNSRKMENKWFSSLQRTNKRKRDTSYADICRFIHYFFVNVWPILIKKTKKLENQQFEPLYIKTSFALLKIKGTEIKHSIQDLKKTHVHDDIRSRMVRIINPVLSNCLLINFKRLCSRVMCSFFI